MATLIPGDVISTHPTTDTLKSGLLLQLPKRACTTLALDSGAFKGFPPKAGDRAALLAYMGGPTIGVNIPEPFRTNEFGKSGWPLRLELNRTLCPWFDHATVQVTADIEYTEGTSPSNGVDAPPVHKTYQWANNTSLTRTENSGTPPGTFGYLGGGVPWTVTFTLEAPVALDGCDRFLRCTAHLDSTNYDFLSGTAVTQVQEQGCNDFHNGLGLVFNWVAVKFNPGDPIGLVRSMSLTVRGSTIYT